MSEGGFFRSQKMSYVKMYVDGDAAHDTVLELGRVGAIEFKDLNAHLSAFQRAHVNEIKRCEEMERKLRVFKSLLVENNVPVNPSTACSLSLSDLEMLLNEKESEILEANRHHVELTSSLHHRVEFLTVLKECGQIYQYSHSQQLTARSGSETPRERLQQVGGGVKVGAVGFLCGCLPISKAGAFERIIFHVTRGNSYCSFREIPEPLADPATGELQEKRVFMVFYSGEVIGRKIHKIAEAMQASLYDFPASVAERHQRQGELHAEIEEIQTVLSRTDASRMVLLRKVAADIVGFETKVVREKAIFHTLNMFRSQEGRKGVEAEGWCPTSRLPEVRAAVERVGDSLGVPKPLVNEVDGVTDKPPTHFNTNKLTKGFQEIVDAYGIANYQEFNPMPFTVITFPFLFAVMFGDLGHGTLMLLFALYMVAREKHYLKNPPDEIFGICFGGRYVILLMGLFSVYTGMLYNDTFAMSFDWFGTAYKPVCAVASEHTCETYYFDNWKLVNECTSEHCAVFYDPKSRVYPFGMDPIWKQSENELTFTNSLKMKLSIVLGVTQMEFGVLLSGLNHIYFRNWISFIHEFIPQVIFLTSVFGYMVLVIFIKWATYYRNTSCAPSILTTFIDMFLSFGYVAEPEGCDGTGKFFEGQSEVEKLLLALALISVPWMLFAKPLLLKAKHARAVGGYHKTPDHHSPPDVLGEDPEGVEFKEDHVHGHAEEFEFGEEMVHQIIHTIEFVLGAVSNTASYLRLWALSLAHAQLSTVFWEKVMVDNMTSGPVAILIAFLVWVCCTFGVLMVMESLSAFLHALRLHWVEFQNKFYKGEGSKFAPFKFGSALA